LSGGQQQRVALARAVVIQPDILLLDEPLGALDLKLRQELQMEIKRVQQTLRITTLYVTHDQGEALSLSNRVAVMRAGRILQVASPTVLYEQPKTRYVASFVGTTNMMLVEICSVDPSGYMVRAKALPASAALRVAQLVDDPVSVGQRMVLCFRPERAYINRALDNQLLAMVTKVTYYGAVWSVSLEGPDHAEYVVECKEREGLPTPGDTVTVAWNASDCFLLTIADD
jgi:ABC-type Fe3+/spermidine/putrescine transport system ATPase subunit